MTSRGRTVHRQSLLGGREGLAELALDWASSGRHWTRKTLARSHSNAASFENRPIKERTGQVASMALPCVYGHVMQRAAVPDRIRRRPAASGCIALRRG